MRDLRVPITDLLKDPNDTVAFEDDIEVWGTKFNIRLCFTKREGNFFGLYEQPSGLKKKYAEVFFDVMQIGGLPDAMGTD